MNYNTKQTPEHVCYVVACYKRDDFLEIFFEFSFLGAECSTLFMYDANNQELCGRVL